MSDFTLEINDFNGGFGPAAHINSLTEMGNISSASLMSQVSILNPVYITQGPGLAELGNLDVMNEMMNFIFETPPENGKTYGIGDTKIYMISSNSIIYSETEVFDINGGFVGNADKWILGDGWAYNDNNVIHDGGESYTADLETDTLAVTIVLEVGKNYVLSANVGGTTGSVTINLADVDSQTFAAGDGVVSFQKEASGLGGSIYITPTADFDGTISDVSVSYSLFPKVISNCTKGESIVYVETPEEE